MSEAAVKKAVKKYLESIGAYYFMPVQMGYGSTTVDFLVCHRGKFYGIETKREGKDKASASQDAVMKRIIAAGGETCVENSTDCGAIKRMMKG